MSSTVERRTTIMKQLERDDQVDVYELSRQFGVSEVTIRKDLRHLEKKNILIRSRGGAMKRSLINVDLSIYERRKKNTRLKDLIGIAGAKLIKNGETILLDSGTTIMELVRHLPKKIEITVITNSIDITLRLAEFQNIRVIVPGGILRRNSLALVGEQAADALRGYFCDKYFLSADGIDIDRGMMTTNIEEAALSKINIKNSGEVVALIDSSKFIAKGITTISPLQSIDILITDSGLPQVMLAELKKKNIKVILADKP